MGNPFGQPKKRIPGELELLAKAEKMRAEGVSWDNLAKELGQSKSWIRYRIDPAYKELRKGEKNTNNLGAIAQMPRGIPALTSEQLRERLKLVPKEDTRDFTGRFCGDPIPGDLRRVG